MNEPAHEPTTAELLHFLSVHERSLLEDGVDLDNQRERRFVVAMHRGYVERNRIGALPAVTTLKHIRDGLLWQLKGRLGGYLQPREERRPYLLIASGVKQVLGVPRSEVAGVGSIWDTPEVHARLSQPTVRHAILAWAEARLIAGGDCPLLSCAFPLANGVWTSGAVGQGGDDDDELFATGAAVD